MPLDDLRATIEALDAIVHRIRDVVAAHPEIHQWLGPQSSKLARDLAELRAQALGLTSRAQEVLLRDYRPRVVKVQIITIGRDLRVQHIEATDPSAFIIPPERQIGLRVDEILPPALTRKLMPHIERALSGEFSELRWDAPDLYGRLRSWRAVFVPQEDACEMVATEQPPRRPKASAEGA
jgi:hypothetical protein